MKNWIPVLLTLLVLGSCTIEKRLYTKGFYVEFRQNGNRLKGQKTIISAADTKEESREESPVGTSVAPKAAENEVNVREYEIAELDRTTTENQVKHIKSVTGTRIQEVQPVLQKKKECKLTDNPPVNKNGNSVKQEKTQKKQRERQEITLSEEAFEFLAGAILLTLLLLCMAFPTFGAIVEMIVGILLLALIVFCVVWVIVWLCDADFGNFPWFWSGR